LNRLVINLGEITWLHITVHVTDTETKFYASLTDGLIQSTII